MYLRKLTIKIICKINLFYQFFLKETWNLSLFHSQEKKYKYLIDSGASDIIINSEIENHLINNGQLLPENYVGQKSYEIANGDIITLKFANLPYIELNNNKFYNIDIAIGDKNSSLLMGMSFLNRFDWKINQDNLILNVK